MKRTNLKMASFKLSAPARGALTRVSREKGWTKTLTLEHALIAFEISLAPKRETTRAR